MGGKHWDRQGSKTLKTPHSGGLSAQWPEEGGSTEVMLEPLGRGALAVEPSPTLAW